MAALVLFPLLTCFALSVGSAAVRSAALQRFAGVAAATVVLASGVALVLAVLGGDTPTALSGQLRVDALSAYMLTVVGAVGLTASVGRPRRPRRATRTRLPHSGHPLPRGDVAGRPRRQPRRAVGRRRGHHDRDGVPGGPRDGAARRWRRRGSTSCSGRSGSRSPSSGSSCSTRQRVPLERPTLSWSLLVERLSCRSTRPSSRSLARSPSSDSPPRRAWPRCTAGSPMRTAKHHRRCPV